MSVIVNGINENIAGMTILELVNMKQLDKSSLIIEYNYNVLKKEQWETTIISDKDNIELLNFVGGG